MTDAAEAFASARSCGATSADAEGNWILRFTRTAPCAPAEGDVITFTLNGNGTNASEMFKIGGAPADIARGVTLRASGGLLSGGAGVAVAVAVVAALAVTLVVATRRRSGNAGVVH